MDPALMQTLSLLLSGAGIGFRDLLDLVRYAHRQKTAFENSNYYSRYHSGMRLISERRSEITSFLKSLYASTPQSPTGLRMVRYAGGMGYDARDLPIVSKDLFSNSPVAPHPVQFVYSGMMEDCFCPSDKELAKEVARWEAASLKFWDGILYSISEVQTPARMVLRGVRFLTYRATIGSILDELALAVSDNGIQKLSRRGWRLLPKRSRYLASLDSVLGFGSRICAGGANVLFAARTASDGLILIVQRRSRYLSDEPGVLSTVPKFFHESLVDPWGEADIRESIYRECYEELFGGEDRPGRRRHISPQFYLDASPPVRELVERGPDIHTLVPLGLSWDLLRGNYHLAYCLFVHDATWWERYKNQIRVNWEADDEVHPAVDARDAKMIANLISRMDWAPEAYVAFVEGLRWLSENCSEQHGLARSLPELVGTSIE